MKIVELLLMGLRCLWQRNSLSPVEVHELEEEDASLCAHGDAEDEHEDANADGEHAAVLEQVLRPVVHDPRDQRLHVAELGVDAKNLEYIKIGFNCQLKGLIVVPGLPETHLLNTPYRVAQVVVENLLLT